MIYTSQWLIAMMGDVTLGWTEDQVPMMTEVIQAKMNEGYTFFIKDDDGREIRLRDIADLQGRNAVTIGDKEAERLIRDGKIGIVAVDAMIASDSETTAQPTRRARSAREAATSRTVATPPIGGG